MTRMVDKYAAQGDFILIAVPAIPTTAKLQETKGTAYVVAHSETGHDHVIDRARAEVYEAADDEFVAYVRSLGDCAEIVHKRDFDTHETIMLPPDRIYEIHRQREYIAEGFRKVQD